MAPEIRLFTTILSFLRTMLSHFHWDEASESSHIPLPSQEGMAAAPRTRSRTRRRNLTSTSRPGSSSSRGTKSNKTEMGDLMGAFGPGAPGAFVDDDFPEPPQQETGPPPAPPPRPSKVPIPDQAPAPDSGSRRRSIFGLVRNSGTDKRGSHSSIPTGNGNRDPADGAIAGHQDFNLNADFQSQQITNHISNNNPPPDFDWQLVNHHHIPQPPSKLTYAQLAQMASQSQDDVNARRQSSCRIGEGEHSSEKTNKREREMRERETREIESLRRQLSEATSHAKQAERAAQELTSQLQKLVNECKTKHIPKGAGNGDVDHLQKENERLKSDLDDAISHIFSLQPYRKDLTPHEVGTQFDDLMINVADWVTRFVEQVQDDPARVEELLTTAKKKPAEFTRLRKHIEGHPDLNNAFIYPDTDIDIFIAVVTRFLHENIFQKMLCGIVPKYIDIISSIETSMQSNVEPKRDLYALRTWRAETLNAVICGADYQRHRTARAKELTVELASIFKPFRKDKELHKFYQSCHDDIILPAIALQEAFSTSTHHYYLDLNPYVIFNTRQEAELSSDFIENLSKLKCENILQNRKAFVLAKLQVQPTREELRENLVNVATLVPALYFRQVGKGLKAPTVVRPQHMLIAWGSQEQREQFLDTSHMQRTLTAQICHAAAKERQSDGVSTWAKLPWSGNLS